MEFWTECIDRKSLIQLEGIAVDLGIFPQYQWVLHEHGAGKYRISEASSGLKAHGSCDSEEQVIEELREFFYRMSVDALGRMVAKIEAQKQRNFELALQLAGTLCPQV